MPDDNLANFGSPDEGYPESLESYYNRLAIQTLGEVRFHELLGVLDDVPNGLCGVELYYGTLPWLLIRNGAFPQRYYEHEYGYPLEDGEGAATAQQRVHIRYALIRKGFIPRNS